MIKTINQFSYKSFYDYSGPKSEFKAKNILFGYNGTGKSSLAKGILLEIEKLPYMNEFKYRFFNKDYINDHLSLENSSILKGVVANFGKESIDIENEIKEKQDQIVDLFSYQQEMENIHNDINKKITQVFVAKKGKSKVQLKKYKTLDELMKAYKVDYIAAMRLVNSEAELENVQDVSYYEKELTNLQNSKLVAFDLLTIQEIETMNKIMMQDYDNQDIPTSKILNWLKEGISIHQEEHAQTCKFCGSPLHLESIEEKVNAYLNDRKQQDLLTLDKYYHKLLAMIESINAIKENNFLFNYLTGNKTDISFKLLLAQIESLKPFIEKVENKLMHFNVATYLASDDLMTIMQNIDQIMRKIFSLKEEKAKELREYMNKINILIKGSIASAILNDTLLQNEIEQYRKLSSNYTLLEQQNKAIEEAILSLKNQKYPTYDFANFINQVLKNIHFDFYLDIEERNYIIKHTNKDTVLSLQDLSEGEKNILALLFFYYELFNDAEQKEFKKEIQYIIIDDPLTCIDYMNKVYLIELLKKVLSLNEPQVFILTHDYDDFLHLVQDKVDDETSPYRFYEVKKENGKSYLNAMNSIESTYVRAFKEMYNYTNKETYISNNLSDVLNYPNIMYQILAYFMSFKVNPSSPTLENKDNVKLALCGNHSTMEDEIQITHLLDIINTSSLKTNKDPYQIWISAKYLMNKIKEMDPIHFYSIIDK